ncbi:MAG: sigma 54-interacting transcriptional regulator [Deltaproteobacteria bacterium]|nr:sigma 54-interacting transcriptional regulator [Deltaproteobacteria bacterium]
MKIDKNEFYREASLPLCRHLNLDKAAWHCMEVLRKYMPVDGMNIQLLEPGLKASRTVFFGFVDDVDIVELENAIVPMPPEIRSLIKKSPLPDYRIINRPAQDPVAGYFMEAFEGEISNLAMFLKKDGKRFGIVILGASGRDRYTEADLELFSLLRAPFTMAVNNYLQSREITRMEEMLDESFGRKNRRVTVEDIVGANFGLRNIIDLLKLVAPLDSPVMITGETGVGKELIAAAIHNASPRSDQPLIRVNCGAIPESVVDSELFGHEIGAFTGAVARHLGRFERANHGTIFLDEIGELKPDIQVKLLRVLQNGEIERVGGSEQIRVDVRIVAATHRDLGRLVAERKFREDLLFRVNVFPIMIPPLRARKRDIPALVDHFIQKKSQELSIYPVPELGSKAIDKLMSYDWPGNVRELENIVERELILSREGPLSFANVESRLPHKKPMRNDSPEEEALLPLNDVVADHIGRVVRETGGRINGPRGAAKILAVHPNTLRNRMIKLGIPFGRKPY